MTDQPSNLPDLSPADRELLDALVECGFEPDALALDGDQQRRARAILDLLGLLDDYPVEDPDDTLVAATLARIDQSERVRRQRLSLDAERERRRFRLPIPDFITVAAVLLIAASIGFPLMSQLRQRSIDARCANNMRMMGYAFNQYAADNDGFLPVARAGLGGVWSTGARNTVNLEPLVSAGYCELGHLDCPGHAGQPGSSYSYQWRPVGRDLRLDGPRMTVILGDLNPLIDGLRQGRTVPPLAVSTNHGGRGQNVLSSDSSVMWLEEPIVGKHDNIWMPEGEGGLRDGAALRQAGDVFLAH